METQESAIAVSTGAGIDVDRIEKELAAMWQQAADSDDRIEKAGIMRACTLNLIVYTTQQQAHEQIDALLDEVAQQHPSRALILIVDLEATQPILEAYASSRCSLFGGRSKQVCGEQVTIRISSSVLSDVSSAIAPLLIPDVPVFLWWRDTPRGGGKLFDRMVAMADRVVINSAAFNRPYDDMLHLAQKISQRSPAMRVSDLNWGQLTPWRTLMANFWDVPDYRKYLDTIEWVVVEYNRSEVMPEQIALQALLITAWLASRLGWAVEHAQTAKEGLTIFGVRARDGRGISVEVREREKRSARNGLITSVALSSANNDSEFKVALSADGTKLETAAKRGSAHSVGRVLNYEEKSEGERLNRELIFLTRDTVYEGAVLAAAQMIKVLRR